MCAECLRLSRRRWLLLQADAHFIPCAAVLRSTVSGAELRFCAQGKRKAVKWLAKAVLVLALLAPLPASSSEVQVCFSPPLPHGCDPTQTIVQTLNSAQRQVLVQAYSFTSAPIAKALVDAKRRGLDVRVILDQSNVRRGYSAATFLEHAGVPVLIDSAHATAHNKLMIIDGQTVVTGSFNFTKAAEEHNAENLLVLHDSALAAQYVQNWNLHAAHSQPMTERGSISPPRVSRNTPKPRTRTPRQPDQSSETGNRTSMHGPVARVATPWRRRTASCFRALKRRKLPATELPETVLSNGRHVEWRSRGQSGSAQRWTEGKLASRARCC
jgi:phosphatidylserine/phosphatidylglycerophosphate/cardiolipin synthase-like enzyme